MCETLNELMLLYEHVQKMFVGKKVFITNTHSEIKPMTCICKSIGYETGSNNGCRYIKFQMECVCGSMARFLVDEITDTFVEGRYSAPIGGRRKVELC